MSSSTLTDDQVVRLLAEREGYTNIVWDWFDSHATWKDWIWERNGVCGHGLTKYLTSRDALAPVLEGLSDEEMDKLAAILLNHKSRPTLPHMAQEWRWLITLPACDLSLSSVASNVR